MFVILLLLLTLLLTSFAKGAVTMISYSGSISTVSDPSGTLPSTIVVSSPVTATLSYNNGAIGSGSAFNQTYITALDLKLVLQTASDTWTIFGNNSTDSINVQSGSIGEDLTANIQGSTATNIPGFAGSYLATFDISKFGSFAFFPSADLPQEDDNIPFGLANSVSATVFNLDPAGAFVSDIVFSLDPSSFQIVTDPAPIVPEPSRGILMMSALLLIVFRRCRSKREFHHQCP